MADSIDWGNVDQKLKSGAGQWYDSSMLGDVQRNASYGTDGEGSQGSVDDWIGRVTNKAKLRGSNEANSSYQANGQGGYTVGPTGNVNNPNNTPVNGGGSGGGPNTAPSAPAQDAQWTALYDQLMQRAKQGLNIDKNDPAIRQQTDAYNADSTRQMRDYLSGVAESSSPYKNMAGETRMANEHVGQATGALQASLIGNELTQRRTEIQNALTQMGGMLTSAQQLQLQRELGLINANLQKTQIGNNFTLGQQSINSGNDQFAAQFGRSVTNDANHWDLARQGIPG